VKKIRSDNGSEFKNLQVEEYFEEEGVKHEFSAPYTTAKRCGREEEQDTHRHGEDDAWRVQDARAVLVGSCEHSLPRHKPALSTSSPQEDLLRTPNR
jgi:predicted nuclease with RNAse H fold